MAVTDTSVKNWLLLGALVFIAGLFWYGSIDYSGEFAHVDLAQYRRMAQAAPSIDITVPAPFAYRILPSWLVGVTPLPDVLAFRLWTLAIMLLLVLVLYRFLVQHGATEHTSLLLSLLFIANPYICGLTLFDYFQLCDALSLLFILLMIQSIENKQLVSFGLLLLAGALTREVNLLMLPVALVYYLQQHQRGYAFRILIAAIPAAAAFVCVRLLMQPENTGWSLSGAFGEYLYKARSAEVWVRLFFNSFAPLSLIPLVCWRESKEFLTKNKHLLLFILLVFISTFFGKDTERLFAPAFAAVWLLYAHTLDAHQHNTQILLRILIGIAALFISMHPLVSHISFLSKTAYYGGSIMLELAIAAALLLTKRRARR